MIKLQQCILILCFLHIQQQIEKVVVAGEKARLLVKPFHFRPFQRCSDESAVSLKEWIIHHDRQHGLGPGWRGRGLREVDQDLMASSSADSIRSLENCRHFMRLLWMVAGETWKDEGWAYLGHYQTIKASLTGWMTSDLLKTFQNLDKC